MNPKRDYIFFYLASRGFVKCLLPMHKFRELQNVSMVPGINNKYMRVMDCTSCDIYRAHIRDYGKEKGWRFEFNESDEPDIHR